MRGGETAIQQLRGPSLSANRRRVAIAALAIVASGCLPRTRLAVHYLPGFVPGSQNIFSPVKIGVPPTAGSFSSGACDVGSIYDVSGAAQTRLSVADPTRVFSDALVKGLKGAGLEPIALDSMPSHGVPPEGSDFILISRLEKFEVDKRFGAEETVHGQYFSMTAEVRAKFELRSRSGDVLYAGVIAGLEDEPPAPVGREVFLPLETEPAESLSVALSRAVGRLIIEPKFRAALPSKWVENKPATPTPKR
ncbi:MAG TPA: hypothetical protein VEU51_05680 [Candidatus Acidoferrales bacterium]|nr:hypothetical protein [Candidatus Acidoferrales bacterium]